MQPAYDKVANGLKAQFNQPRVAAILQQAESMFLEAQFKNGRPKNAVRAEPMKERFARHNGVSVSHSVATVRRVIEPPIDGVELFLKHIPMPGDLRVGEVWQNSIEYRNILVIGDQGSGKTTIDESLAYALALRYHAPLKVCMAIQTAGIDVLIDVASRNAASAYFLCGADLTLAKIPKDQVNRFFQVRHVIQDGTGVRRAIVVTSLESHTLFGIEKNLRTTFTMMFVKSIPTNPYDRSLLKRYIDPDLLNGFERTHTADECLIWDAQFAQSGIVARIEMSAVPSLVQVGHKPPSMIAQIFSKWISNSSGSTSRSHGSPVIGRSIWRSIRR